MGDFVSLPSPASDADIYFVDWIRLLAACHALIISGIKFACRLESRPPVGSLLSNSRFPFHFPRPVHKMAQIALVPKDTRSREEPSSVRSKTVRSVCSSVRASYVGSVLRENGLVFKPATCQFGSPSMRLAESDNVILC